MRKGDEVVSSGSVSLNKVSIEDLLNRKNSPSKARSSSKNISSGGGGGNASAYVSLNAYANGTRNSKGKIFIKDEKGQEAEFDKLQNGKYAIANEGSQVFTKKQTDRLYELANSVNAEDGTMVFNKISYDAMQDMFSKARVPEPVIDKKMSVPVYIDNRLIVNGDVNDLKNLQNQMQNIADRSSVKTADKKISEFVEKMYDGYKYGRY